jgi:hypothetical protein
MRHEMVGLAVDCKLMTHSKRNDFKGDVFCFSGDVLQDLNSDPLASITSQRRVKSNDFDRFQSQNATSQRVALTLVCHHNPQCLIIQV